MPETIKMSAININSRSKKDYVLSPRLIKSLRSAAKISGIELAELDDKDIREQLVRSIDQELELEVSKSRIVDYFDMLPPSKAIKNIMRIMEFPDLEQAVALYFYFYLVEVSKSHRGNIDFTKNVVISSLGRILGKVHKAAFSKNSMLREQAELAGIDVDVFQKNSSILIKNTNARPLNSEESFTKFFDQFSVISEDIYILRIRNIQNSSKSTRNLVESKLFAIGISKIQITILSHCFANLSYVDSLAGQFYKKNGGFGDVCHTSFSEMFNELYSHVKLLSQTVESANKKVGAKFLSEKSKFVVQTYVGGGLGRGRFGHNDTDYMSDSMTQISSILNENSNVNFDKGKREIKAALSAVLVVNDVVLMCANGGPKDYFSTFSFAINRLHTCMVQLMKIVEKNPEPYGALLKNNKVLFKLIEDTAARFLVYFGDRMVCHRLLGHKFCAEMQKKYCIALFPTGDEVYDRAYINQFAGFYNNYLDTIDLIEDLSASIREKFSMIDRYSEVTIYNFYPGLNIPKIGLLGEPLTTIYSKDENSLMF